MDQKKVDSTDLYFFNQGKLHDAYRVFGAHLIKDEEGKILGTEFTVWAPHAKEVNVVGEFNNWEGWKNNLHKIDNAGIWRLYVPNVGEWARYKYEIKTFDGRTLYKSDPYAFFSANRPETESKVYDIDGYHWNDKKWFDTKKKVYNEPMVIYEVHLGSWRRRNGEFIKFNEIADELIFYLEANGFTHVEFMPIYEHPLDDSWGYQGTGYYSATSRFGVPKDLMYLIDRLHQANIGVIIDWVPGHICRDPHGLYMFDGEPLYEYQEAWMRENEVWGTANMDLGKGEVQSFLISNALFWMKYFHVDGFRVDAVANLIYYLGNKNIGTNYGAIDFLRNLSRTIFAVDDRVLLMAEDSTAHEGVTRPVDMGGLGFNYKWNMGWMNDVLRYFSKDPIYRKYHHNDITFGLTYAFSEQFVLPFSHDEVVHGKGSLINKMPGDYWQKFANLRLLFGFWATHPGKKLLFMGGEFGQFNEWAFKKEIDWNLYDFSAHETLNIFFKDIVKLYKNEPALYKTDHKNSGFAWIDSSNAEQSIFSFIRYSENFDDHLVIIMNCTPVVYHGYEVGVPGVGEYEEIINSDKIIYGGSGQYNGLSMKVFEDGRHNQPHHIKMLIPPLGISVLKMKKNKMEEPVVEKANEEELDLESKNLTNLKALAKEKGIKGYSQMKKDELIKQIKACK